MAFKQSIEWAILVRQSSTTKMESKDSNARRLMMKPSDMEDQGCSEVGKGWSNPYS